MSPFDLSLQWFPSTNPDYAPIADDPPFDPARHLALDEPEQRYSLHSLGYREEALAEGSGSDLAATSCFRVLSDEGVAALYHVCKQLESYTTSNPRVARNVRGGVYRSRFLRDLALSPELCTHLSHLMQAQLQPHSMAHQLAHLNFQPHEVGKNIDKWHFDTLQVDFVMFVTDPNAVQGGAFQYFTGTRGEMQALRDAGQAIPPERIVAPAMPGAGYAVLMQGNYVVHQAKAVTCPGERITLVNGYHFADLQVPNFTALKQLHLVDSKAVVDGEYARQMALRCAQHLQPCVNRPSFEAGAAVASLRQARAELDIAIATLEDTQVEAIRHFGD